MMKPAGKPILFLALAGVAVGLWFLLKRGPQEDALRSRALATRGLAESLAGRYAGHRALVVSNPFTRQTGRAEGIYAQEKAGLRGLAEGFQGKVTLEAVVFPELKPEAAQNPRAMILDPSSPTPLSFLVADGAFDKLAREHPHCDLIVSLIGLPAELRRVEAWRQDSPVKFALLFPDLRLMGGRTALREAMQREKLAALVLPKPNAPSEQTPLGADHKNEFDKRFVLVTADNLEQAMQRWPQLFPE
jgi:hypothetical protein